MDKTSLILHGHFYQPPRENPETGIISKQESASPWTDWNERICDSCYSANLNSRYLDRDGRILRLRNNYAHISWNFGPTLLSWLDTYHPEITEGLRAADRESRERLGHGNAMAQSFNHTILPLDREDGARLQIDWGIQDFQHHFGRDPEGMWLPECAINDRVTDYLAEAGISFVVLSPWQCRAVEDRDGRLTELEGAPAPYSEPFILTGRNGGRLTAFFYEPSLASGISFGHYLRSADSLYDRLLSIRNDSSPALIHTATDGEIYGHHEPFGDMALAALIEKIENRDDFVLDNYASFMERHPAVRHAVLKDGEDGKGTSWSCSHGVSRWYKDCGCHTGGEEGWNQKWRSGLRTALENLGDRLDKIFRDEVAAISPDIDSFRLLSAAGSVFTGSTDMRSFILELSEKYNIGEKDSEKLMHLISAMKYRYFSLTSCGFFFSELSGIEPRQDIRYAIEALSVFQRHTGHELMIPFLEALRAAKSNIREKGDGMLIAQEEIGRLGGSVEAALYFHLNSTMATGRDRKKVYGRFSLSSIRSSGKESTIAISDNYTGECFTFHVLSAISMDKGINLYITKEGKIGEKRESFHIANSDVPKRVMDEAKIWLDNALVALDEGTIRAEYGSLMLYSMLLSNTEGKMDAPLVENLGTAMRLVRSLLKHERKIDNTVTMIRELVSFIEKYGGETGYSVIRELSSDALNEMTDTIRDGGLTEENALLLRSYLSLIREAGVEPDLRRVQNLLYPYYSGKKKAECSPMAEKDVYRDTNFS